MRIGIVNDMIMVVELLKHVVASVPPHEVAWVAYDGEEALRRCAIETPDLILMDLIMPVMNGVEATRRIMQSYPCAILIVTASVLGNISKVFEAMGHGALDVVRTPTLNPSVEGHNSLELRQKIETIQRLLGKEASKPPLKRELQAAEPLPPLIVMGASTGGPLALREILSKLPADFPAAIIIIQHVDAHFLEGFVRWLGERCCLPVRVAQEGELPAKGTVLVAGTQHHLVMNAAHRVVYSASPKELVYRPSVDVFFESVDKYWPMKGCAVLLTGMGKDGARGLRALLDGGWHTIVEHKDSCVVYGMPKAALELCSAHEVLPLAEIAPRLLEGSIL